MKTRLTSTESMVGRMEWSDSPQWSPDGTKVLYSILGSRAHDLRDLRRRPRRRAGDHLRKRYPHASRDWTTLVFVREDDATACRTSTGCRWKAAGEAQPIVKTAAREYGPAISPDGEYVTYISDETGRREAYITSFPDGRGKWQASTNGAASPQWNAEGDVLYFEWGNKLWKVEVTRRGSSLSFNSPELMLDGEAADLLLWNGYHVPPDRDGILTIRRVKDEDEDTVEPRRGIHVVENWLRAFGK